MYKSIVSTVFFLLCVIAILLLIVFYNKHDVSKWPNDYAIVFDAGSSGSRMYVYQWKSGFSAARGDPLVITESVSCKTSDNGLDKITSKKELIEKYSPCVKKAKEKIPEDRKKRTYLFLAATAGMRLLEARNKTASDQIFGYVRDYFRTLGFLFTNDSQARIITGQEEGADAWISANYFEKTFMGQPTASGLPETKGILDLGGASTQIVFVPKNPNFDYKSFFTNIRILGKNYQPYSFSFLCWGLKEATHLYKTYLITKNNYRDLLPASCFPMNARLELSEFQITDSPCINGLLLNDTLDFKADLSRITKNKKFTFTGQSNPRVCEKEIEALLPTSRCDFKDGHCSFYNTYLPPIEDVKFLGFSSFYFSKSNSEKLLQDNYDNDLEKFKKATDYICSRSYPELVELNQKNKAGLTDGHLKSQCFSNLYSIALTSRYGFTDYKNFKATDKINGFSLNWALGYLINELNRDDFLPYEEPPRYIDYPLFLTLLLLFGLVGSCFLIYVLHKKIKLDYKRTDQPKDVEEGIPISIRRDEEAGPHTSEI